MSFFATSSANQVQSFMGNFLFDNRALFVLGLSLVRKTTFVQHPRKRQTCKRLEKSWNLNHLNAHHQLFVLLNQQNVFSLFYTTSQTRLSLPTFPVTSHVEVSPKKVSPCKFETTISHPIILFLFIYYSSQSMFFLRFCHRFRFSELWSFCSFCFLLGKQRNWTKNI